jgi:putative NADH-flavin reductase
MTRVLVLGATGGTGREVVAQALARGHTVTALVRDPGRLPAVSDRLRVVTGSVMADDQSVATAMRDQDAVISTLGVGKSFASGGLIAESMPRIVRAMVVAGVRRIILTSAFGVGATHADVPVVPRIFIRLMLKDIYRDKAAGEAVLHATDLDWTVVYPTGLSDGPATGGCRAGERLDLRGFPNIRRTDVAGFLLSQIDDRSYVRKGVLISS